MELKCACGSKDICMISRSNFKLYGARKGYKGFRYVFVCRKCYKSTIIEYCQDKPKTRVIKVYPQEKIEETNLESQVDLTQVNSEDIGQNDISSNEVDSI